MKNNTTNIKRIEKMVKSVFKKKISITESLLVFFLITGNLGYSDDITKFSVKEEKKIIGTSTEVEKKVEKTSNLKRNSLFGGGLAGLILALEKMMNSSSNSFSGSSSTSSDIVIGNDISKPSQPIVDNPDDTVVETPNIPIDKPVEDPDKTIIKNEVGMKASGEGEKVEFTKIYEVRENGIGLIAEGKNSKVINSGEITVNSESAIGMQIVGIDGIVENNKKITVNSGVGIESSDSSLIINNKQLDVNAGIGIFAYGGESTILNDSLGVITVKGEKSIGIKGQGVVSNRGKIEVDGGIGIELTSESKGSSNQPPGVISVKGGGVGVRVMHSNGRFDNLGKIDVTGANSVGISTHAIARNLTGLITVSDLGIGMVSHDDGVAVNKGKILGVNNSEDSIGMYTSKFGHAINDKDGTIEGRLITGIKAEDEGTGINKGKIDNGDGHGMYAIKRGIVINDVSGVIVNKIGYGMAVDLGTATNKGTIAIDNDYAILVINGLGVNEATGKIINSGAYGMWTTSSGSIMNHGLISNKGDYGMYVKTSGSLMNSTTGVISNNGNYGMFANGYNSMGINEGTIKNGGPNKTGTSNGGVIVNNNPGTIYVDGENAVGMTSDGTGSLSVNKGKIVLSGNNQKAMVATNGATIINDVQGKIYLSSATNSIGLYASGRSSVLKNDGTIYLDNGVVQGNTSTVSEQKSVKGNQAIVVEDGATFVNNGLFSVKGEFDSSSMGSSSQFVVEGGTVEADTIRGDYYASGALAWGSPEIVRDDGMVFESTEYADQYDTYQMFKTENMYANIYSNSAMFDVVLTQDNTQSLDGYYGITMYRKSFYEIVENNEFAKYLEKNYTEIGKTEQRTDLYDAYKLITNTNDLNVAVRKTFGETIYPVIMEQNYKIVKANNDKLKQELFNKKIDQEVGEYNFIGYATYIDSEDRESDNFSENDLDYSAVSIGVDKKINQTTRVGILGTAGKVNGSFDDGAKRKDDAYQLNAFSIYEKNGVKGIANVYAGKIQGDLDRKLAITSLHEEMETDIESNFYGVNLSLEKEYEFHGVKISPKLELNSMFMEEEKIKEKGEYALDVNGVNGKSVESGIGLKANKRFLLEKGYAVTPEIDAMYYRELGNPYKDRSVKLSSVSNDSVGIQKYEEGKDTGKLDFSTLIEKEGFGVRAGVTYEVKSQETNITPYVTLGYIF